MIGACSLYRKVLVLCADSDSAAPAVAVVIDYALARSTEVLVLHVVHPREYLDFAGQHEYDRVIPLPINALQSFEQKLAPVLEHFADSGIPARLYLETGDPSSKICEFAQAHSVDLIVMTRGSMGFWESLFRRSVSEYLLRNAPCSLLVAQQDDEEQ